MRKREIIRRRWAAVLIAAAAFLACSGDDELTFPRPTEPLESTLYDLVLGPIDRASAFDVVAGRGVGTPRSVRVDRIDEWDVVFAFLDGEPVWLPRGFFDGLEVSSGILSLRRAFEEIMQAPENRDLYETENPVPIVPNEIYVFRSRNDPTLSFPCRIYAVVDVEEIDVEEARVRFRYLWNPNCDDRDLSPEEVGTI